MIDLRSDETHLLLNPRMPEEERAKLERLATAATLRGHVWIATSGTSGALKLTALSKDALLASAAAVNAHLGAGPDDPWYCVLPDFHVGGLGIHARAMLSGARVFVAPWDARVFAETIARERVAFSALVPAQVSDLVRDAIVAPPSIRAIVVGGGALAPSLIDAGRELGWPLLQSYGMTECCSQVATATYESSELRVLPHLQVREEEDGLLAVCGSSLLTGYAMFDKAGRATFIDPKTGGWFVTEDLGEVKGRVLRVARRRGDFVKIGGESVDLRRLDRILEEIVAASGGDAAVLAATDERLGHVIHVASTKDGIAALFDQQVMPFERARAIHRVSVIPRSPLGKLLRTKLAQELGIA
ncbi:MAG: AMP-binding protein [Acidobacteriota bacterium]